MKLRTPFRYARAWEVARDGSLTGLAFTGTDLHQHAPTRLEVRDAAVHAGLERSELVLYGDLVRRNLFRRRHAYALEIWTGPLRGISPCDTAPASSWSYLLFPLARPKDADPEVDEATLEYVHPKYVDEDGAEVDAIRFDLLEGNRWGRGPHPVRMVAVGDGLEPARFDDEIDPDRLWQMMTVTMSPSAALQYTDYLRARTPADVWPS